MIRDTLSIGKAAQPAASCVVCFKPIGPREPRWTVHFRGAVYTVCCPSCAQVFNRSPQQFLEQP